MAHHHKQSFLFQTEKNAASAPGQVTRTDQSDLTLHRNPNGKTKMQLINK